MGEKCRISLLICLLSVFHLCFIRGNFFWNYWRCSFIALRASATISLAAGSCW